MHPGAEAELLATVYIHVQRHRRLYGGFVIGLVVYVAMTVMRQPYALMAAGDTFFAAYLFLILFVLNRTADQLRERAAIEDEGILLVVLIVLTAISTSLFSIEEILHQSHGRITLPLLCALAGAPLGWFTLHIVAAFHYASLYYSPNDGPGEGCRPYSLLFPGEREPAAWDFVYYAFVVGMTAQVSDVQVTDTRMRRATLGHSVVSFFFNTVLIAMAVNAVVTIAT